MSNQENARALSVLEAADTNTAIALGIRRHRTAMSAVEHAAALEASGVPADCQDLGDGIYLVGPADMFGAQLLFAGEC